MYTKVEQDKACAIRNDKRVLEPCIMYFKLKKKLTHWIIKFYLMIFKVHGEENLYSS